MSCGNDDNRCLAKLRGRAGGLALSASRDSHEYTAAAREASPGSLSYWFQQVDPGQSLTPEERTRRADAARRLYFTRLALKSAQARRRRS